MRAFVIVLLIVGAAVATWLPASCTVFGQHVVERQCCQRSFDTGGMCAGPMFPCCRVTTAVVYTPMADVGARIPAVITQHTCTATHALNTTAPCVYRAAHAGHVRWTAPTEVKPLIADNSWLDFVLALGVVGVLFCLLFVAPVIFCVVFLRATMSADTRAAP